MKTKMLIALIGAMLFCFGFGFGVINTVMDIDSMTNTKVKVYPHYGIVSVICIVVGFILTCTIG